MKNIKISNNFLSWIFGCECEFNTINNNHILFDTKNYNVESLENYCNSQLGNILGNIKINIHTFIHLAKVKAFECGYELIVYADKIRVFGHKEINNNRFWKVLKESYFNAENKFELKIIIDCLEWVAEKVGGSNV